MEEFVTYGPGGRCAEFIGQEDLEAASEFLDAYRAGEIKEQSLSSDLFWKDREEIRRFVRWSIEASPWEMRGV